MTPLENDPIVPLISTSVAGPLGIMHLPRLWLKLLLHSAGRLPEGYRHGSGGFDELFCTHFGIDQDAFVRFVEADRPDYLETERWVEANAKNITPETIAAFNDRVLVAVLRDEMAAERREKFGIEDSNYKNAVRLNDLDDWAGMHAIVTKGQAPGPKP
jgi:hypothetical protein